MIGILVTGHGNFATGISSSVKLIAGMPEKYEMVDFLESYSVEDLTRELNAAMDRLSDCEGILVFSDLAGGSPFKTAVEVGVGRKERVEVLGGTNLGMIIEISMARGFVSDMDALVEMAVNTGKDQVVHFVLTKHEDSADEDGI